MKSYPRYKPTGLAWLPSVPEHWEATKIRTIFTERTTKVSDKDYPPLSVSKGGVVPQIETVAKSDDSDNRKLVRIGDFVINSRSDRKGSSGVSELDGSVSLVNLVLKPRKKGNGRFLHYLLKSDPFVEEFYRNGHGIVADLWTTRYSEMKSIYIPLPPPSEQDRIVRYLDEKTAAIDELVRAKERQIELLRELIVWHTEDAMRTVPKARFRLKRFVRQIAEEITVEPAREYHPLGVLNRGRGLFHKEPVLGADLGDSTFFHVHPGDMIISGQFAWEGAVAMLEESERGCVASHRYPLVRSASNELRLEYLWAFFQTHYGDMVLNLHSHGAAGRNRPLNFGELLDEYVPVPSLDRQATIVELVKKLSLVRRTAKAIKDRMAELRTRLVSDVVTGAVEV